MRKIYSLVLMATMLLMGTNAWAEKVAELTIGSSTTDVEDLYTALTTIQATPNTTATIVLTHEAGATLDMPVGSDGKKILTLNEGENITLDLNGKPLKDEIRINIKNAKLQIINSSETVAVIDASSCNVNRGAQPFNVYGVSATDNTVARDASYLKIGERVKVSCKSYAVAQMYYDGSVTSCPTYGATIDIYGELNASEGTAIANNGTMNFKDNGDKSKCPVINIRSTAVVRGSSNLETIHGANTKDEPKAVYDYYVAKGENGEQDYKTTEAAVYGPGYGEWNIEGTLYGGVGLYLKAGKYNINNAKVYATAAEYWEPIAYGNGFIGAGSAIVFDSHISYGGQIEMTIGGTNTQVSSNTGYAIEDTKTTENAGTPETAVNEITINGGSFASSNNDVITTTDALKEKILENGSINGGTYSDATIAEYIDVIDGALQETAPGSGVYQVVEGCNTTLNASGLATFSSPDFNVVLPAGVTAWIATGNLDGDGNLNLSEVTVSSGSVILPKATGFILYGTQDALCNLVKTEDVANVAVGANLLLPSTAWGTTYTEASAYILHGNELWIYNGTAFKAGKAFLPLSAITTTTPGGAPKRVGMIFNQTETPTAVENVETQNVKAVKFVGEDGQLYIRRGEAVYTVQGQVVK